MVGVFKSQLFMVSITAHYPYYNVDHISRYGMIYVDRVRYRCPVYPYSTSTFSAHLLDIAPKSGVKEQTVEMAFNRARVQDTAHALNMGINTILHALNFNEGLRDGIALISELNKQWPYVGNKNNRH